MLRGSVEETKETVHQCGGWWCFHQEGLADELVLCSTRRWAEGTDGPGREGNVEAAPCALLLWVQGALLARWQQALELPGKQR